MQPIISTSCPSTRTVAVPVLWPISTLSSAARSPHVTLPNHRLARSAISPVNMARSHPTHSQPATLTIMLLSYLVLGHSSATAPLSFTSGIPPGSPAPISRSSLARRRQTRLRLLLPSLLCSLDQQLVLRCHWSR